MNCHICNQHVESFLDQKTNIKYYHCKPCEYIFKSPEYYQDFVSQKERYNLHENNEQDNGYQAYFRRFLDYVLPSVDSPINALDFGCGTTSLLAKMLDEKGIKTDYYDPIYHPNKTYNSKKYELIVSTEVFEHLHNPKEVFKTLVEHLESGGYLALQTQFHSNDKGEFKKWYYHQDPTHIVFFTAHTFKLLCNLYGCKFVKDNGTNMVIIQKI